MLFRKTNANQNVNKERRRFIVRLHKGTAFKQRRGIGSISLTGIIMLAVGLLVAAAIVPTAITDIENANTTGWDASTVTIWGLIGTFAAIGIALSVLGIGRD